MPNANENKNEVLGMLFTSNATKPGIKVVPQSILNRLEKIASTCDNAKKVANNLLNQLNNIIRIKTGGGSVASVDFIEATEVKRSVDNLAQIVKELPLAIEQMNGLWEEIQQHLLPEMVAKPGAGMGVTSESTGGQAVKGEGEE